MRAYMPDVDGNGEEEPIGRIVVLEDTDDDGVMDKSSVVMDGLVLPRAIAIVKGGLLVAEPPTIRFVWQGAMTTNSTFLRAALKRRREAMPKRSRNSCHCLFMTKHLAQRVSGKWIYWMGA